MPSIDQLLALREGRIDAAFVIQCFPGEAGLHRMPLLRDPFIAVMAETHPLAYLETLTLYAAASPITSGIGMSGHGDDREIDRPVDLRNRTESRYPHDFRFRGRDRRKIAREGALPGSTHRPSR